VFAAVMLCVLSHVAAFADWQPDGVNASQEPPAVFGPDPQQPAIIIEDKINRLRPQLTWGS
jgi:hypothetical protein